jgi:hypothetical protein
VTNLEISSGVNARLEPFCTVSVDGKQIGQLEPAEVRTMALQWLEAAEAAETDAMVWGQLQEMDLNLETCTGFLSALRNRRDPR